MDLLRVSIAQAGYEDRKQVIQNVSFSVRKGEWIGLIGANGAGKSTTIKAILGLLKECNGSIEFCGLNRNYAYIPEQPIFYDDLTLWEHLELAGAVWELDRSMFVQHAERLLEQFQMTQVRDQLPGSFSKGMQQKTMLILGFLLEPDLYIVDEPFIGLDPRAMKQFIDLIELERQRGAGILMSTHVLDTAERYCDSFLFMSEGSLVASGSLNDMREHCHLPDGSLFDCFNSFVT